MPAFEDKRERSARGFVSGTVTAPGHDPSRVVRYRTAGPGGRYEGPSEPEVNWSAMGSVPVAEARRYAEQIIAACDAAEVAPRPFEPDDEITYSTLKPGRKAFVLSISDDGFSAEVEHGVPGEEWQETRYVETLDLARAERV